MYFLLTSCHTWIGSAFSPSPRFHKEVTTSMRENYRYHYAFSQNIYPPLHFRVSRGLPRANETGLNPVRLRGAYTKTYFNKIGEVDSSECIPCRKAHNTQPRFVRLHRIHPWNEGNQNTTEPERKPAGRPSSCPRFFKRTRLRELFWNSPRRLTSIKDSSNLR